MSQENADTVRGMYEAFGRGDISFVLAALDPEVEWREAENFIYADGNPYVGPDAVLQGVFARLAGEWEGSTPATRRSGAAITAARTRRTGGTSAHSSHTSSRSGAARS